MPIRFFPQGSLWSSIGPKWKFIRPLRIEDILECDAPQADPESLSRLLKGKTVFVVGIENEAAKALCRRIASYHPFRLIITSRTEHPLFEFQQELAEFALGATILPRISDPLSNGFRRLLARHSPDVLFSFWETGLMPARAENLSPTVKMACLAPCRIAEAAWETGVKQVIFGYSSGCGSRHLLLARINRLRETYLESLWSCYPEKTSFSNIRFPEIYGEPGSTTWRIESALQAGKEFTALSSDEPLKFLFPNEAAQWMLGVSCLKRTAATFEVVPERQVSVGRLIEMLKLVKEKSGEEQFPLKTGSADSCLLDATQQEFKEQTSIPQLWRIRLNAPTLFEMRNILQTVKEKIDSTPPEELERRFLEWTALI